MIDAYTLDPPHDLCKSAVDVALRKLGKGHDFYVLVCHDTYGWLARKIKEVLSTKEGISIDIVLRSDNNQLAWCVNAFNNKGPPFLIASCHSNPPA